MSLNLVSFVDSLASVLRLLVLVLLFAYMLKHIASILLRGRTIMVCISVSGFSDATRVSWIMRWGVLFLLLFGSRGLFFVVPAFYGAYSGCFGLMQLMQLSV